jgi:Family of unknown function (DUF6263)
MMRLNLCFRKFVLWLPVAVLVFSWTVQQAAADEPLRWKVKVGDKHQYEFSQHMEMTLDAGPKGKMNIKTQRLWEFAWRVKEVNAQGDATIEQSIARVQLKMSGRAGQTLEYDSNSKEPPVGPAASIGPMFDAMRTGSVEFTLTPRGEIRNVTISPETMQALRSMSGGNAVSESVAVDGLKKMPPQVTLIFPEGAATPDQPWSTKTDTDNSLLGKETVQTTYRYEGNKDMEGTTFALIQPTLELSASGTDAMSVNVKEQKTEGEILFNPAVGWLHSSHVQQDVNVDLTKMGQTLPATIKNVTDVKVTPAE